jgi:alkylation response protein AidB-like acyl-CoA dehydrogenase
MDFGLEEEQLSFKRGVINFAKRELNGDVIDRDKKGTFSWDGWKKCAKFGIQGLPIPEEYGGGGSDILTTTLVMEGLGYGCRDKGLIFSINAHMWSSEIPILTFGTEEQKREFLPKLSRGEYVGVHAITEPDSGSDAFSLRTTAERRGDRYVINGTKTFITNGDIADLVLVFATVDRSKGFMGVTGILVEKGTPGFSASKGIEKMGLRTSPMSELIFEGCEVPIQNRLGREGSGSAIFNSAMEWERSCILASNLGAMEYQMEKCVAYARERKQFGKPIGKFQSVSNMIADMKIRLEAARLLLYRVAWLKKNGKKATLDAAIAKIFLSESSIRSSLDAVQIHGAYGYTTEFEVERDVRDSIAGTIYSGTTEIQKMIIASLLGL